MQDLLDAAVKPLAANPALRKRILELRVTYDRVIDEVSVDVLLDASGVVDTLRARSIVESWRAYLDQHRDEITAIQLIGEARERRISFADIAELAERIRRPTTCLIAASPRDPVTRRLTCSLTSCETLCRELDVAPSLQNGAS